MPQDNDNNILNTCDECKSQYFSSSSKMKNLCPECSHVLYGYENCNHQFVNGKCTNCFWDGSRSEHIRKLIDK